MHRYVFLDAFYEGRLFTDALETWVRMVAPQSSVNHHVGVILMTLTKLRHPVVASLPDQLWSMNRVLNPLVVSVYEARDSYLRGVGDPFADAEEPFDPV